MFYPLAAKAGASCDSSNPATIGSATCVFQDVTKGNNSVPCTGGSPNCSAAAGTTGVLVDPLNTTTPGWTTTVGFDRATGLGTINAANLVNRWTEATFTGTTTTFAVTSTPPFTHGQAVNLNISVAANTGTVFPTGSVSLIADFAGSSRGVTAFTLSNATPAGTSAVPGASTIFLPGGTYNLTAHYAGDGTFGASDSPPVSVTVNRENSLTTVEFVTFDVNGVATIHTITATTPYGSPYILRILVTRPAGPRCDQGAVTAGYDCPTGTLAVTDTFNTLTFPLDPTTFNGQLNSFGVTEDIAIQLPGGAHGIGAQYPGDNSYVASAGNIGVTITKAVTTGALTALPNPVNVGQPVTLTAVFSTQSNGAAPTGTVTFFSGTTPLTGSVTLTGTNGGATTSASLQAVLTTTLAATGSVTAQYTGDGNYTASTSPPVQVTVTGPDFTLGVSPASATTSKGGTTTYTITVTSSGGFNSAVTLSCPNVPVVLTCGAFTPASVTPPANGSVTSTVVITATSSAFLPPAPRGPDWRRFLWRMTPLVALFFALILIAARTWDRRRKRALAYVSLGAFLLFLGLQAAGCGGTTGGGGSGGGGGGTSPRNYTFTITGTSGALARTSNSVTLTVN